MTDTDSFYMKRCEYHVMSKKSENIYYSNETVHLLINV